MHRDMELSLVPCFLIQSVNEWLKFLRKVSLRDFGPESLFQLCLGWIPFFAIIAYLHCLPMCNESIYILFHNSGRSYFFLWLGLK